MSLVIDASVALAWCFRDQRTIAMKVLLDRVSDTGATAPQLWPLETLNSLLVAERRKRINADERFRLTEFLEKLPVVIDDETVPRLWRGTSQLAILHRLTAYDATYLELALRLGLPLATNDRALSDAATRVGVAVLPTA